MVTLIVLCAKYLVGLPVVVLLYYLFILRSRARRKVFILTVVSLPLVYLCGLLAEHFYYSARPFVLTHTVPLVAHAPNNGFPSDHTLLAAGIASVVLIFNRPLGILLWVVALGVGASRVAAGIHHWSDIAGAAAIALVVVLGVYGLLRRRRWYRGSLS